MTILKTCIPNRGKPGERGFSRRGRNLSAAIPANRREKRRGTTGKKPSGVQPF
jgi:hypothetical protein